MYTTQQEIIGIKFGNKHETYEILFPKSQNLETVDLLKKDGTVYYDHTIIEICAYLNNQIHYSIISLPENNYEIY